MQQLEKKPLPKTTRTGRGVTLSDIAERIGVSKVTVCYVLNGRESNIRISERTRQRVIEVAKELGYHPNAVARGLARRRMDTFTLVMQSPNVFQGGSGFINALMHGVVESANSLGYDVMLHTKALPDVEAEVHALIDGRADGSLLLRDKDDPLANALTDREHPCVSIFCRPDSSTAWYADCDNWEGGRLAGEYLLSLGHRRIGFVGGNPHSSAVADRGAGFRAALSQAGVSLNPAWSTQINYSGDDFAPLTQMMQAAPEDRPTALFVWSDDVAARAIQALRETTTLRVPDDLSIIGFDGTDAVGERGCFPRLTSIRQPIEEIAAKGVRLLVAQIQEERIASHQALFAPTLVERETCALFRG